MSDSEAKPCCRWLRTRSMYFEPDERPGKAREGDDTMVFYCLKTHAPIGPDGVSAAPAFCCQSRECRE